MLKFISICSLNLLFANLSLFGGNPLLPETLQNKEKPKICFTENKGQVYDQNYKPRPDVLYGAMAGNMAVHIKTNGVSYQLYRVDKYKEVEDPRTKEKRQEIDQQTIYRVDLTWQNANKNFTKTGGEVLTGYNNYYLENCPNGALKVKSYKGITLNNLYNGINLHYYEKNGELKYDYIVAPFANYKQIQIKVEGATVILKKDGSLLLTTPLGKIQEEPPIAYQDGRQLTAKWIITDTEYGRIVSFEIENYNPNDELIIDPFIRTWSTYYGGTGDENGSSSFDISGNVYIVGQTGSNTSTLIATTGAHQTTYGGGLNDAFLAKFNNTGQRLWGTYYGGAGNDKGNSCSVVSGFIYMAGTTESNTGSVIATSGAHQTLYGGGLNDAFLVLFDPAGIRQWGTYYGGAGEDWGYSCSTNWSGSDVFMVGGTTSNTGTIIATSGSHQSSYGGGLSDGFLVRFNSAGVRQWGTYYGGNGQDEAYFCNQPTNPAVVVLTGYTSSSTGSAIATPGSHQSVYGGNRDAFFVKFNFAGVRQWGTYYGDTGDEYGYSCYVEGTGDLYLAGTTQSNTGTVIATVGSHQLTYGGGLSDGFLVKFNSTGQRQWGTNYGGAGDDQGHSCNIGTAGGVFNVYLSGHTSSNSGTNIATPGSYQSTYGGGTCDAFLVKFNVNTGQRLWGTYYGGTGSDYGFSTSAAAPNDIYLGGQTSSNSGTIIATTGSHQSSFGGGALDTYLVKFKDCVYVFPLASVNSTVCAGGMLNFTASLSVSAFPSYSWSGPASFTSNVQNPVLVSAGTANIGIYTLTINNLGCIETATTFVSTVLNLPTIFVNSGSICSGNSFTVVPSGANTYSITGGSFIVSPNVTTSYTVTGTSTAGCISSPAISLVLVNPKPTISVNSGSICISQSFAISPSGANTYTITGGSFIVSPNITSSYSVTGTSAAGCVSGNTAVATVFVSTVFPVVSVNSGTICAGEVFTISPSGANSYSVTGGSFIVNPNTTTSYSVTGSSVLGCVSTEAVCTVSVDECVGINEHNRNNEHSIKIYPNPNNGLLIVESHCEAQVLIIDLQGRIVGNLSLVSGKNQISIEQLENGVYFLELSHPQGKEVFRIIKQ